MMIVNYTFSLSLTLIQGVILMRTPGERYALRGWFEKK